MTYNEFFVELIFYRAAFALWSDFASIVRNYKMLSSFQDEKYDHLSEEDIKTLAEKDAEFQGVFNDFCNKATSQKLDEDPLITVAQINLKRKVRFGATTFCLLHR